jgi:hypothetical protein
MHTLTNARTHLNLLLVEPLWGRDCQRDSRDGAKEDHVAAWVVLEVLDCNTGAAAHACAVQALEEQQMTFNFSNGSLALSRENKAACLCSGVRLGRQLSGSHHHQLTGTGAAA